MRKGDIVRSKHDAYWTAEVLGFGKHETVRVVWKRGPLAGREALVAREALRREAS